MSEIDPQHSTSPNFGRKTFVGIGAAGALAAASLHAARAQTVQLGKVHAPLVAEDDPDISVEHVQLTRPDARIGVYAAAPKNASASTPGVVVVMHIWGVDTSIRDMVRRLAKIGYAAIAPDLFARYNPPTGDGATDYTPFAAFSAKLSDAQVDGDLRSGAEWLRSRYPQGKRGVMGFCMGGAITLRQTVDATDIFSAASVFYGKVRYSTGSGAGSVQGPATRMALAYSDEIGIPLQGSWGERDTSIPAADVRQLATQLKVPHDIKVYPEAGHAFMDDQRDSYVASAATDAWERLQSFFAKYLRP